MGGVFLWGRDTANSKWIPIIVDEDGKLKISDADPFEVIQDTPEDLKHVPHGRVTGNGAYLPFAIDANGKLLVTLSSLAELNDIDDVNVPSPTNLYIFYWNNTNSKWECRAFADWHTVAGLHTAIEDIDADTGVYVEESADEDKVHMKVAGIEGLLMHTDGILDLAKQSAALAYPNTANQSIPSDTETHLLLDTEEFDVQNEFDTSVTSGTADATEANKLHDADGGFTAADVGKTVWNTTDDTYTTVTGFVDSGELDLDDDIMANGEGYKLYFSRFTVTKAGRYLCIAQVRYVDTIDGKVYYSRIRKNGGSVAYLSLMSPGTDTIYVQFSRIINLSVDDYLDLSTYHDSGVAKDVRANISTHLAIHKLA